MYPFYLFLSIFTNLYRNFCHFSLKFIVVNFKIIYHLPFFTALANEYIFFTDFHIYFFAKNCKTLILNWSTLFFRL
jgi:hypothetical protein